MKTARKERKRIHRVTESILAKSYFVVLFVLVPCFAYADFKSGAQKAIGVGAIVGFLSSVFFLFEGVWNYRNGGNYGKDIVGLIVCAGATLIATAIFTAMGLTGAALTPVF